MHPWDTDGQIDMILRRDPNFTARSAAMMNRFMAMSLMLVNLLVISTVLCDKKYELKTHASRFQDLSRLSTVHKVAFGSCNDDGKAQQVWQGILHEAPDLWLWAGDNIYGDIRAFDQWKSYIPPPKFFHPATPEILHSHYVNLLHRPGYRELIATTPVIGIWDDHDYGINDGDRLYRHKDESQQLFLDFIGEPDSSPRRSQRGIYTTHDFGDVKFILLDNRYHKDPYGSPGGTLLGPEQWTWLQHTLESSTSRFNIIVAGIQMLPTDLPRMEYFNRFPHEREKLLDMILNSGASGVLLLSGDVHFGELNQVLCTNDEDSEDFVRLDEITSSGMTHSLENFRDGGLFARYAFRIWNAVLPFAFRPIRHEFTGEFNFGTLVFDWQATPPVVSANVHNARGEILFFTTVTGQPMTSSSGKQHQQHWTCVPPHDIHWIVSWLCLAVFGLGIVGLVFLFLLPVLLFGTGMWKSWQYMRSSKSKLL